MADAVVVGGNVQGNITSCELKDIISGVQRNSVLSFTEVETHTVYDVCTKQISNTYTMPVFTGFGTFSILGIVFFVVMILWIIRSMFEGSHY